MNPMRAIVAPPVEQRVNDFLSADEDAALLSVECSGTNGLSCGCSVGLGYGFPRPAPSHSADVDLALTVETVHVRISKTPAGRRSIPLPPFAATRDPRMARRSRAEG